MPAATICWCVQPLAARCFRPEDTVARFSGDEFAILIEDVTNPSDVTRIADRAQRDSRLTGNCELMTRLKFDTVVLGAGIVGVCVAVHLQKRGRQVALVDRKLPGNETSFGNAGLIQREGVYPYAFPRDLGTLLRYARNQSPDVRYHADAMLKAAPFLWQYWRNSHPAKHAAIAKSYSTLIEHCVSEHRALAADAGASALLRPTGWIKVFRTDSGTRRGNPAR